MSLPPLQPTIVPSPDKLLSRGISEYTILPRILGRGKFSTVFLASKPSGPNGSPQLFAVKHTPLFQHHPLIATRLLREPTLLAELPPHPNLVTVTETIRTPGHFYLVEEYLGGYVTLEALLSMRSERSPPSPPTLPTGVANCLLDQLLSAVHAIHHPLQICHRDIKPENILVHPDTLQLKLLDFGLATHYSKSEPKLTTCCGSPAFHCPEIVTALRNPVGSVRYWGPEVDVWTCGITMLRVLTGVRYPIGASHTSVRSMAIRAQRAVATIPDPELRDRVGKLLDANGERRIRNFEELVKHLQQEQGEPRRGYKDFKSTTFIPTTPQHTMHLPLVVGPAAEAALNSPMLASGQTPLASRRSTPAGSRATSPAPAPLTGLLGSDASPPPTLVLGNPTSQPPQRVLSFIKYCLRCAGILYHSWPDVPLPTSLPSTPGQWEAQLADLHEKALSGLPGVLSGLTSASSDNSSQTPNLSPTTPLLPQLERPAADPFVHIQILECVLELVDEPEEPSQEPQTLVQTIMSALSFGRRPANRRSLSTPPKPDDAVRNASRERPAGMPNPPGTPANAPASGSASASGKAGDVKCLTFYLVIRFPKRALTRPPYSRSASLANGTARSRSRASSRAAPDTGRALHRDESTDSLSRLASQSTATGGEYMGLGLAAARRPLLDSNSTTPRASRTSSPSVAPHMVGHQHQRESLAVRRGRSAVGKALAEDQKGDSDLSDSGQLTIETRPERLRPNRSISMSSGVPTSASAPGSRSGSRAPSRTRARKESRARGLSGTATPGRKSTGNKVFIHVTDDRALAAVRKALSVGGTTNELTIDALPDAEDAAWVSPVISHKDLRVEDDLGAFPGHSRSDQKPRRPGLRHRPLSYDTGTSEAKTSPDASTADDSVEARGRQHRSEQMDQSAVVPRRPRSTISDGSDDRELFSRGRPLSIAGPISISAGVLGAGLLPSSSGGIPFPSRRHRARSQLSNVAVQEESPSRSPEPKSTTPKARAPIQSGGRKSLSSSLTVTGGFNGLNKLTQDLIDLIDQDSLGSEANMDVDVDQVEQACHDLGRLVTELHGSDQQALADELEPISFDVFKALSPCLGLVNTNVEGFIAVPSANVARETLATVGELASPRELYMAIDLRMTALKSARPTTLAPGDLIWSPGSELVGLIRLLTIVVPRIKTKKPESFSSVFASLPTAIAATCASTTAGDVVLGCCELLRAVAGWEQRSIGVGVKLSREARTRFLAAIASAASFVSGNVGERFFRRSSPRYASGAHPEPEGAADTWEAVSRTLSDLNIDLTSHLDDANAFIVHVHTASPDWGPDEAEGKLETALPLLMQALNGQMALASSSDETLAETQDPLAEPTLLWTQWGVARLTAAAASETVRALVRVLAAHAPVCPVPLSRLARIELIRRLVVTAPPPLGVEALASLVRESPFVQIRAAAVAILRDLDPQRIPDELLDTVLNTPQTPHEADANAPLLIEAANLLLVLLARSDSTLDRARSFTTHLVCTDDVLATAVDRVRDAIAKHSS